MQVGFPSAQRLSNSLVKSRNYLKPEETKFVRYAVYFIRTKCQYKPVEQFLGCTILVN